MSEIKSHLATNPGRTFFKGGNVLSSKGPARLTHNDRQ
jgi:hypothetical protein